MKYSLVSVLLLSVMLLLPLTGWGTTSEQNSSDDTGVIQEKTTPEQIELEEADPNDAPPQ